MDEIETPEEEDVQRLVDMMFELAMFTERVQNDISAVLIQNPNLKKETEKLLQKPDHEIINVLDKATGKVILAMPLASMYGVNLLMNIIEHHSSMTGDPAITDICRRVQERINSHQYN